MDGTAVTAISGTPSEDEVAAILAAVAVSLPRRGFAATDEQSAGRWRFSGRWWSKPVALRRDRPWEFR
jgi:hypothetical protein